MTARLKIVKNDETLPGYTRGGDAIGTHLQGYVTAVYSDLEEILGQPEECDGYKVSGEWTLTDSDGNVVTLYDWKSTELYDPDYPSVSQFRRDPNPQEFNIGGCDFAAAENFRHNLNIALIELNQRRIKQ